MYAPRVNLLHQFKIPTAFQVRTLFGSNLQILSVFGFANIRNSISCYVIIRRCREYKISVLSPLRNSALVTKMKHISTYERIIALYSRNENEILTLRVQNQISSIKADELCTAFIETPVIEGEFGLLKLEIKGWIAFEAKSTNKYTVGVICDKFNPTKFESWFIKTVLLNGMLCFKLDQRSFDVNFYTDAITDLFASTLKYSAADDKWATIGIERFKSDVRFFVSRGLPVEAVLPAFPCKSSNRRKVRSALPDKGEEIALQTIIDFVTSVNDVYPPGLLFYIVSDGHVFSDCINVNDNVVDEYTEQLKSLYKSIKPTGFDFIRFRGLNDCFMSEDKEGIACSLDYFNLNHHLNTELDEGTEINRKILMQACDNDCDKLKMEAKNPDHPRLSLHRGFMTFMREDLRETEVAKSLSNKKYKRLISLIAFEMIKRNDAYSNLVELMFPFHIRLSIHAHKNSGPKFGIKLLSKCKLLGHDFERNSKALHIPTPWHNAIFRIGRESTYFVSALRNAEHFISDHTGGWSEKQKCFVFQK